MRTGRILDSRRTRQEVVQQKFALRARARFNPFRDSAGCTIAMRWQRRLKSNSSEDQTLFLQPGRGTVHILCEHLSPDNDSLQSQTEGLIGMRKKFFGAQRFGELQDTFFVKGELTAHGYHLTSQ